MLNGLPLDRLYPVTENGEPRGSEPKRSEEVLQSWEAVKILNKRLVLGDTANSLRQCLHAVTQAQRLYDSIPLRLDEKSNKDHLEPLREGVEIFKRLAELDTPTDLFARLAEIEPPTD